MVVNGLESIYRAYVEDRDSPGNQIVILWHTRLILLFEKITPLNCAWV